MLDQRPPNTRESDRKRCTTKARMPADAHADAGRPLRRTTADAKNPGKKAADAFPAFEKYKVIQSNPPCGCPSGCGTLYGGEGVFCSLFAVPSGSLRLTSPCHALRSMSSLPIIGASFPSCACHALPFHKGPLVPGCPCHILSSSGVVCSKCAPATF